MRELRFSRELYSPAALDGAVAAFLGHAAVEREESPGHWVVRIRAADAALERSIAGELGNFALGLTVQDRGRPA